MTSSHCTRAAEAHAEKLKERMRELAEAFRAASLFLQQNSLSIEEISERVRKARQELQSGSSDSERPPLRE